MVKITDGLQGVYEDNIPKKLVCKDATHYKKEQDAFKDEGHSDGSPTSIYKEKIIVF